MIRHLLMPLALLSGMTTAVRAGDTPPDTAALKEKLKGAAVDLSIEENYSIAVLKPDNTTLSICKVVIGPDGKKHIECL